VVTSKKLIQTLQPYVPAMIVRRLAEDPSPIRQPSAERLVAVVMFADITDFTSLADRLSQHDQVGPEELAALLNDYFDRLIDIIQAYGGEVTKFAGDALIALWPLPMRVPRHGSEAESVLTEMACLATQCGLEIQQSLADFSTVDGSRLFLQVGIGVGDVYSVHLGGVFDRWEFLLSGTPLVQMSLAKQQASPGHVVLSAEVWELVQNFCVGEPVGSGFVKAVSLTRPVKLKPVGLPLLTEQARNGLQSYIPAAILSRLEAGHEDWISEIRRVTVMFVKLPGYGTSIKHPYMRTIPEAQAVMEALQKALYRYAGSINKFNVDDKGITLVAALGLPPLSHCDDAARAVHVAFEMQKALEGLNRPSAIGITTGWVFCGPVGNEQRREYTMVGTVVNMAARLMQAAEERLVISGGLSDTLCDKTTYDDIRDQTTNPASLASQLTFQTVRLTGVKGMQQTVASYRPAKRSGYLVVGHRSIPEKVRIAGLNTERSYLANRLRQLGAKNNPDPDNLLIIEGDSGSGKTQLISELLNDADRMKIHFLISAGEALDQTTPYLAWQPIFERMFGLDQRFEDQSKLRSQVLSQLPSIRGEKGFPAFAIRLAPLLNSVLPLGFPESRMTENMEQNVRQRMTHQFLLKLLQRNFAGEVGNKSEPALLVFEDGHWLDEYSWRLILDFSQQVQSLLILVATRRICERALNPRIGRVCRWLNEASNVGWLVLGKLSQEDNLDLLRQQLGVQSFPEPAFEILRQKTGGHPLFSIELAQYWQKNGQIKIEGDSILLTVEDDKLKLVPIPKETHQIITGRLERLSPTLQLILKIASVIGKEFSAGNLAQIFPLPMGEENLIEALNTLETQDFIARLSCEVDPTYKFTSDFIQEVALSLLPQAKREELTIPINQSGSIVRASTC
jgi:class 3 adenylate cyclase